MLCMGRREQEQRNFCTNVQCNGKRRKTFIGQAPGDYTGFKLAVFEDELGTFTNDTEKVWEGKPHE